MKRSNRAIELLGWYGAAAIAAAYALVSLEVIASNSWAYQLLNLTGALGILVVSVSKKDRQPAALNIFWAVIAFVALVRLAMQ